MEASETKHSTPFDKNKSCEFDNSIIEKNLSDKMGERHFTCTICCESFASREHLEKHSLSHIGEGPFLCNMCNKPVSRQDLKRHSLLHRAERPHVCNICNKSFAKKAVLNKHLIWHSGLRPYICSVCNKSFMNKGHLDRHSLIHSGVRPHVCNICNKSFSQKWGLKKHILTHREKRPYVCSICHEAFASPDKLKEHSVIHSKKIPEKGSKRVLYTINRRESSQVCSFCNKVFAEHVCVKLLLSHQSEVNSYACNSCLVDFAKKVPKGNMPVVTGTELSMSSDKSNSMDSSSSPNAFHSSYGSQVHGDVSESSDNSVNDDHDVNKDVTFDAEEKCDSFEETIVKEEHDIDYEEITSDIKKESDIVGQVTNSVSTENHNQDSEKMSPPDNERSKVQFDVMSVNVKEEPDHV